MAEIISSKIRTVDNIVFRVGEINPNNNNERFADYDLENNQNKPLDADIQGIIDNAYGGKYTNKSFRNYNLGEYVKAAISVLPLVSANVVKHELYTLNKDDKNRIFYKDAVYEQSDGTHYYVPKAGEIIIHQIKTLFGRGLSHFCNLLMTGESGFGKTQFAKLLGKILNVDIVKIDMSAVDEKLDVLGYIELINKDGVAVTQWTFNDFIQRIAQGNCLVILDELDKCEPKNASILNPLLDGSRSISYQGKTAKVGENVVFVSTANRGWKYTGASQLDASIVSRHSFQYEVGALPPDQEKKILTERGIDEKRAIELINVINKLRELHKNGKLSIELSHRKTVFLGELLQAGAITDRMALEIVYGNQISGDDDGGKNSSSQRATFNHLINSSTFGVLTYERIVN